MADALPAVVPAIAPQPDDVAWPTDGFPEGSAPDGIEELVERAFTDPSIAETYAVVLVHRGRLVAERYGGALPSFTSPPKVVTRETPLLSWSIAKSVLHAAIGILVDDGRLDPDARAPVAEWSAPGDPRGLITLRQLLQMRDGLEWREDYVDDTVSDVIEMLFGAGIADTAAYAASHPLAAAPGTRFNYSSGTSNIVGRILADVVGRGDATARFLRERLFEPIGITDATITLDGAGTFIASSYVYCSARSWAKFATLYLRGGTWDKTPVLSPAWVGTAQVPTSRDEGPATYYSHHWWLNGEGSYWASGHEGQRLIVSPSRDAVLVRLGHTETERYPELRAWCDAVLDAIPASTASG